MTSTKPLIQFSRPRDTTLTLSTQDKVDVWINKSIFTIDGQVQADQKYTDVEGAHLLSFQWPSTVHISAITHWTSMIKAPNSNRRFQFVKTSLMELCMKKWEILKTVLERCCERFNAFLLEVSLWEVKLGHKELKSAQKAMKNPKFMTWILDNLWSDTEFSFLDVSVEWDVTLQAMPVQESSEEVSQNLLQMDSLVTDGLGGNDSATGCSHMGQILAETKKDERQLFPVLKQLVHEVLNIKQLIQTMNKDILDRLSKLEDKIDGREHCMPPVSSGAADNRFVERVSQPQDQISNGGNRENFRSVRNAEAEHDASGRPDHDRSGRDYSTSIANRRETARDQSSGGNSNRAPVQTNQRPGSIGQRQTDAPSAHENREAFQSDIQRDRAQPQAELIEGDGNFNYNSNSASSDNRIKDSSEGSNNHGMTVNKVTGILPSQREDLSDVQKKTNNLTLEAYQQDDASNIPQSENQTASVPKQPSASARQTSADADEKKDVPSMKRSSSSTGQQSSPTKSFSRRPTDGRPERTKSVSHGEMEVLIESETEAVLVKESVHKARMEDKVKAPKAKSFDTILCLDISESMKEGGAFQKMKEVVLEFIMGVEDIVTNSGVEENIGLVAFGGRANVVQNLTNDFNLIRDRLGELQPGGKSPFVEALLVSMTAFVGKGGVVNISGEWEVKPRIIFISDGKPTESALDGSDLPSNPLNVRMALSRMLMNFKKAGKYNKVHPVVFIPVGQDADKKYMTSMSKLCGGEYLDPEKISSLCSYFTVQETIGKVLVCLRQEAESHDQDQIEATVSALTPELSDEDKQSVLKVLNTELASPTRARSQHPKPHEFDNVFEDTDKVNEGERLPLGTRVIRGPDWDWEDQDGGGPGTVINHEVKHSIHWVDWDFTDYNCYPYSSRRGYHIWKTEDHPRLRVGDDPLEIGMTVKRGKDWNPQIDQEQGVGKGVIIRKSRSEKKVMVRWSNGIVHVYNWSPNGLQEVDYCSPNEDPDNDSSISGNEGSQSTITHVKGDQKLARFEGEGEWQWLDKGSWRPYDAETNKMIEAQCKKQKGKSCLIERNGINRRIMFMKMIEKSVHDGSELQIRRIIL